MMYKKTLTEHFAKNHQHNLGIQPDFRFLIESILRYKYILMLVYANKHNLRLTYG